MKGAFLLSEEPSLFRCVATTLRERGADVYDDDGGVVQWRDEAGRLISIYANVAEEAAWEYRNADVEVAPGIATPDLAQASACLVECRWEDWFTDVMHTLSEILPFPIWVLDGNSVLWPAGAIDRDALTL